MSQISNPVIYAVWTDDRLVKIGRTENLPNRLRFYRISADNMHRLLLVMPGSLREERAIQRAFGAHLARGQEYFRPSPQVVCWVNEVRGEMGVPEWHPGSAPKTGVPLDT